MAQARALSVVLAISWIVAAVTAPAAVWHVRPDGDDAAEGRSWATALATIRAAATNAVAGDEIWAVAGTYTNTVILKPGTGLFGGFTGTETEREQARPEQFSTILDGGLARGLLRVANGTNGWTRLDGLTFQHGRSGGFGGVVNALNVWLEVSRCRFLSNGVAGRLDEEAALRLERGRAVVRDCEFLGNRAYFGGALRVWEVRDQLEIRRCLFRDNEANQIGALSLVYSAGMIEQCEFLDNRATTGLVVTSGGAIQLFSSPAEVRRCRFVSNRAVSGAAVGVERGTATQARTVFANNLFLHNLATGREQDDPAPVAVMVQNTQVALVHNTFLANAGGTRFGSALGIIGSSRADVVNNLFLGPPGLVTAGRNPTNTFFQHNLFFSAGADSGLPAGVRGTNGNLVADPRLPRSHPALAPQPQAGSPALDAGTVAVADLAGAVDFAGRPRMLGAAPDLGALESDGTMPVLPETLRLFVKPDGDDAADGVSWATALKTLGAALSRGAFARPIEVSLAGGVYQESVRVPPFVSIRGGFAGTETNPAPSLVGAAATVLVASESEAVMDVSATGDTVELANLRFAGGAPSAGGTGPAAAALLGLGADTRVRDCEFVGISSRARVSSGSAAHFTGAPVLERCVFRGNAAGGSGVLGVSVTAGRATIVGCLFESNHVASPFGRAVALAVTGAAEVANCVFRGHLNVGNTLAVVTLAGQDGKFPELRHSIIVSNRPAIGGTGPAGVNFTEVSTNRPLMRACIVAGNALGVRFPAGAYGLGITNNVFFGNARHAEGLSTVGPPFNFDFDPRLEADGIHLLPDSPARDLGGPAGGVDFDGEPRWMGAASDLGADELSPEEDPRLAALAALDWRVVTVGDLAYLRYAGALRDTCAVALTGTLSNGVVHVTPLPAPGNPPCDEPPVLRGHVPLGGWQAGFTVLPIALDGRIATGVVTPAPGELPAAFTLLPGAPALGATVLGLPGITYTLERTEDFLRWEMVAELRDATPAGDPDQPVLLEHQIPAAGTNGVLRLRM